MMNYQFLHQLFYIPAFWRLQPHPLAPAPLSSASMHIYYQGDSRPITGLMMLMLITVAAL